MSGWQNNNTSTFGHIKSALVMLVSGILLWLTIRNSGLHWSDLSLNGTQAIYLILSMAVFYFTIYLQSIRSRIPWRPFWKSSKPMDTFNSLALGNFYNCILPGNLGEAVRVWHLSRKNNVPFVRSVAAHGVEKYIDAFGFVNYVILVMLFFKGFQEAYPLVFLFAGIVFAVILLYLLIVFNRRVETLMAAILFRFMKTGRWLYKVHYYIKSMLVQMSRRSLIEYVALGYCLFFLNIIQYYLVMLSTGVQEPILSVSTAVLVAAGMVIVSILPSAPGNIGVLHYGIFSLLVFVYKLNTGNTPPAEDLQQYGAFTVYLHLSYFLPEIVLGLILLIKERKWLV